MSPKVFLTRQTLLLLLDINWTTKRLSCQYICLSCRYIWRWNISRIEYKPLRWNSMPNQRHSTMLESVRTVVSFTIEGGHLISYYNVWTRLIHYQHHSMFTIMDFSLNRLVSKKHNMNGFFFKKVGCLFSLQICFPCLFFIALINVVGCRLSFRSYHRFVQFDKFHSIHKKWDRFVKKRVGYCIGKMIAITQQCVVNVPCPVLLHGLVDLKGVLHWPEKSPNSTDSWKIHCGRWQKRPISIIFYFL